MSNDGFDAIIVGAGLAGSTAAYLLAKSGLEVLLVEKGNFAGAKNVTGGRLYAHSLEKIMPDFANDAPLERCITQERISMLQENDGVTIGYSNSNTENPSAKSYSVLRNKFDQWLAGKAEEAGANVVSGIRVDKLIQKDGKVTGIVAADEEMEANVVILADGVNSLLAEQLNFNTKVTPHTCAVGVKEIIGLDPNVINDRFGCSSEEGVAWLFAGSPSAGCMGGGFIYTNKDSISLGLVLGLHEIENLDISVPQLLENFKANPIIKPLIKGGELLEYSAHVVPEGGYNMLPKLVGNGVIVAGDAAGFCLNTGYTVRGMDLAIASGECAAKAILLAKEKSNFDEATLSSYVNHLKESFVMKDLNLYKKMPKFMENKRLFTAYPKMLSDTMHDLFTIDGPCKPLRKSLIKNCKQVGFLNLIKDGIKGMGAI